MEKKKKKEEAICVNDCAQLQRFEADFTRNGRIKPQQKPPLTPTIKVSLLGREPPSSVMQPCPIFLTMQPLYLTLFSSIYTITFVLTCHSRHGYHLEKMTEKAILLNKVFQFPLGEEGKNPKKGAKRVGQTVLKQQGTRQKNGSHMESNKFGDRHAANEVQSDLRSSSRSRTFNATWIVHK